MKILIITKRAPFEGRGAEQVIWKIANYFADSGHCIQFFCPTPTSEQSIPDIDGVNFSFVKTGSGTTRSMIEFFLRGPLKYQNVYDSFAPDIVYDNPSPFPFHLAHIYGSSPVVTKVHAIYRQYAFPCKDHPLVQLGTIFGEETYRLFRNETFITNSESTAERLRSLVNQNENDVIANPIGIDTESFEYYVPPDSKHVVTISKLSPRKRISDLLRAWKEIEKVHPDASLTVAGSGPLTDELRELAAELELSSVEFPGFVSEDRKHKLLHDAAIFVAPTLYEGFGISILEAMASGCAVVASDTWGAKDYLVDGYNGRAVPPKTPSKLADAVIELLSSYDFRQSLSRAARETATEYSIQESIERELEYVESSYSQKR